ncbi:MAG: hypothetical protein H8E61_03935 [Bacteroidetes bacterium]|nr:hypothetical protein [Bacteroidota bacterium]
MSSGAAKERFLIPFNSIRNDKSQLIGEDVEQQNRDSSFRYAPFGMTNHNCWGNM